MTKVHICLFIGILYIGYSFGAENEVVNTFKVSGSDYENSLRALGLQPGDIIKEVNGVKVNSINEAQKYLGEMSKKNTGSILVLRKNELVKLNFKIK